MLERSDEHDRTFVLGDLVTEVIPVFELGRDPQAENADGRFDSLDPANFRYQMNAAELLVF